MLIRSIKINKKIIILGIIIIFLLASIILFYSFANETSDNKQEKKISLKEIDERILTIDDFLNDFENKEK